MEIILEVKSPVEVDVLDAINTALKSLYQETIFVKQEGEHFIFYIQEEQ